MFVHHHQNLLLPWLNHVDLFPPNPCCDISKYYVRKHSMNMIYTHPQLGILVWNA